MKNWIKKHPRAAFWTGAVFLSLLFLMYWMRQNSIAAAVEGTLTDEPRGGKAVESDFYVMQLTGKEAEAYGLLQERLDQKQGGIVEFPEKLSGEEYLRVTTVLEDEGYDYFYGFVDIPMTENGVYVKHGGADLMNIKEKKIAKAILFLSCAEGIQISGEYADDGRVMNLEEAGQALAVNDKAEEDKIGEIQVQTEEILSDIIEGLPEEYGEKRTADYFLDWLDENLSITSGSDGETVTYSGMKDVFEGIYIYNNLSAVTLDKATALGYAKILSELFNRAGMESHIVRGIWGRSQFRQEGYVLTAVEMNGQTLYIDASGAKSGELADHRFLREQEAKNHMKFVEYFDYTSDL
ncbi:hypothetical protein C808_04449 [Lachnospiraceae bacterium M18-1]|nr:hypothetical protein C808_04449 [Lachnospiraceae bacterium M18-1]